MKIRLFTMTQSVEMVQEVFDRYIEPVAKTYMKGEVPQIILTIHRTGTKEKDWLAQVRFKETPTVSLFRLDIYLDDVFRMCRMCKLYLQTEEIFPMILLYHVLHPLFQSQWNEFTSNLETDYDNMMIGAAMQVYEYAILNFKPKGSRFAKITLDVLHWNMMKYANLNDPDIDKKLRRATRYYQKYCLEHYHAAYSVSSLRRAHNCMVDEEGLIRLERLTKKEK